MRWPLVTRKKFEQAYEAGFADASRIRAQPLTRGWAVDLNYEVFHCPDGPRLRALIVNALQQAAGAAERPGIRQNIENFRPLGEFRP